MSQANQAQCRVWLLDEDLGTVALATQACALNDPPIELVVVKNSDEALEWMANLTAQNLPDFLLLDLNLPKLSALAVLRTLRMGMLTKDLHIVVFSAAHEAAEVQQSYQVGANSFVEKPHSVAEFSELLQTLIGYWVKPG